MGHDEKTAMPRDRGFFMPAEWQPHLRCWMAWPTDSDVYTNTDGLREAYAQTARAIARFEPVIMLCNEGDVEDARRRCGGAVEVVEWCIDDSWTRDSGPTFVINREGRVAVVDWVFNGWGGLSPSYEDDAALARRIAAWCDVPCYPAPITLEGGAIHTDGQGTLLTTESVVLNENRNPGLGRKDAEAVFRAFLGVEKVIWLENVMEYDETGGHVDNLACFVAPGVVALLSEKDPADPQAASMRENARRLKRETDARGRVLEVIEIQQPARRTWQGHRLPLSYINFYLANEAVILPVFDDPADGAAVQALKRLFPRRAVVAVSGVEIVKGGGCIHCITQQQPSGLS